MDDKTRAGLEVPNFKLYQDTICLAWIRDWLVPTNKKLLNIEGFNKRYGWHSYQLYGKLKVDELFAHHYIRSNLLNAQSRYLKMLGHKKPLRISQLEVLNMQIKSEGDQVFSY